MARISNLNSFNGERINFLNISRNVDEALTVTTEETREIISQYIEDEFGALATKLSKKQRDKLEREINQKLVVFENALLVHLNDKFNKLTEKILSATTERMINEEVTKRVNKRIEEIKKLL